MLCSEKHAYDSFYNRRRLITFHLLKDDVTRYLKGTDLLVSVDVKSIGAKFWFLSAHLGDRERKRESNTPLCSLSMTISVEYVMDVKKGNCNPFQNKSPLAFLWPESLHILTQCFYSEISAVFCCGKCNDLLFTSIEALYWYWYRFKGTGIGTGIVIFQSIPSPT